MERKNVKKDPGTIFNPVMYLMILFLSIYLMLMFISYRRMSWVSETITNAMTDALLGAAVLEAEELYAYGNTDEIQILYPRKKYDRFQSLLIKELGLTEAMESVDGSIPLVEGKIRIEDFVVYSINGNDVITYDFDEQGAYMTSMHAGQKGIIAAANGMDISESTLLAKIRFTVRYMGIPMQVSKYHMVDIKKR